MGVVTVSMKLAVYGSLAAAAGQSLGFLTARPWLTGLIGRAAGALFIAVALLTLWESLIVGGGNLCCGLTASPPMQKSTTWLF
ncbi:hypothetical protein E3C22_03190 [Jiella endophytica]|uniref:GDT1 family protein n=1 Tax=Jiella endophytica TaxID=2558362 RepID=A0A4Y8RU75_9HYPH|nr:hypothetical protein [Jiella endophytica]TFF27478.1 hypothetical protein E3C22_03190 [Jiella endophytica]